MSLVLRPRRYRSAREAEEELAHFRLPGALITALSHETVILAEGGTGELDQLLHEIIGLGGTVYRGTLGGRNALLLPFPLGDASGHPLLDDAPSLSRCMSLYRSREDINVPLPDGHLRADRTLVMGVLNVTPDSFSDGGCWMDKDAALSKAERMVSEGADIIDVGGESTRPGWRPIGAAEEISRAIPIVRAIVSSLDVTVSIDTMKPEVANAAMHAGASIINDIDGLRSEDMLSVVRETDAAAAIMHMRGTPASMHAEVDLTAYGDVVADVMWYLNDRMEAAEDAGIDRRRLIIDPGLGFGKCPQHNLELLRRCREFRCLGAPVMIGASRKRFIGQLTGTGPEDRIGGSVAAAVVAAMNGASIVRVHDVGATVQAMRVTDALMRDYNTCE